jgi:hypothetical protein
MEFLLNYANPSFIEWALKEMNLPNKRSIQIGIYAFMPLPTFIPIKKRSYVRFSKFPL